MRHLLEPTVTSTGQALIGNVDPEVLEPITFSVNLEHLQGYLNFAAENARQALNELSSVISDDSRPNGPTGNALIRPLRMFFGELNSAIELALRLTAAKVGFQLPFDGVNWEMFAEAWKLHGIKPETLDDLKRLGFDWDGINLFEIRTYAKQATQGVLHVQCAVRYLEGEVPAERLVACMLSPCRKGEARYLCRMVWNATLMLREGFHSVFSISLGSKLLLKSKWRRRALPASIRG